jgi:hypothetical protein
MPRRKPTVHEGRRGGFYVQARDPATGRRIWRSFTERVDAEAFVAELLARRGLTPEPSGEDPGGELELAPHCLAAADGDPWYALELAVRLVTGEIRPPSGRRVTATASGFAIDPAPPQKLVTGRIRPPAANTLQTNGAEQADTGRHEAGAAGRENPCKAA